MAAGINRRQGSPDQRAAMRPTEKPTTRWAKGDDIDGSHGRPFDPSHVLEYALCYAAFQGHRDVVEFLLSKQPDLDVREPAHGCTAIGMAKYRHTSEGRPNGSPEIVALLEAARQAGT